MTLTSRQADVLLAAYQDNGWLYSVGQHARTTINRLVHAGYLSYVADKQAWQLTASGYAVLKTVY